MSRDSTPPEKATTDGIFTGLTWAKPSRVMSRDSTLRTKATTAEHPEVYLELNQELIQAQHCLKA